MANKIKIRKVRVPCVKRHIEELKPWHAADFYHRVIEGKVYIEPLSMWAALREVGAKDAAEAMLESVWNRQKKEWNKEK